LLFGCALRAGAQAPTVPSKRLRLRLLLLLLLLLLCAHQCCCCALVDVCLSCVLLEDLGELVNRLLVAPAAAAGRQCAMNEQAGVGRQFSSGLYKLLWLSPVTGFGTP
jgi:hypothetical protein